VAAVHVTPTKGTAPAAGGAGELLHAIKARAGVSGNALLQWLCRPPGGGAVDGRGVLQQLCFLAGEPAAWLAGEHLASPSGAAAAAAAAGRAAADMVRDDGCPDALVYRMDDVRDAVVASLLRAVAERAAGGYGDGGGIGDGAVAAAPDGAGDAWGDKPRQGGGSSGGGGGGGGGGDDADGDEPAAKPAAAAPAAKKAKTVSFAAAEAAPKPTATAMPPAGSSMSVADVLAAVRASAAGAAAGAVGGAAPATADSLRSANIAVLKDFLRRRGAQVTGTRPELLDRALALV